MKFFLVALLFLFGCSFIAEAQKNSTPKLLPIDNAKMSRQIDSSMKALDSLNSSINDGYKQTMHTMDSINNHLEQERNERNLNEFMAMQKEQQEKQKKAMWRNLALGIFFLAILIIGIFRKRKKPNQ